MRWLSVCVAMAIAVASGCADRSPTVPDAEGRPPIPDACACDVGFPDTGPRSDAGSPPTGVAERARALATRLRGDAHFMVGMGNDLRGAPDYDHDLDGAYTLGVTMDLHYAYLTGYSDTGGWPTWNAGGTFVDLLADSAERHGVTPMFTYYALALELETGSDPLSDGARIHQYLLDVRLMFERLAAFGAPAVVQFEPDFFGYLQGRMRDAGTAPDEVAVALSYADFHDCDALPATAHGLGQCLVHLARTIAPMTAVGFHASQWADYFSWTDPSADIEGKARSVAAFLRAMGADVTDFVTVETLDRDAGFWEAYGGSTTMCSITDGPRGAVYWDESNATLPNFEQHLRWVRALTEALGLPALWWQMPFGVPSDACGGSDGRWRDNRVRYFFSHVTELVAAGGMGMAYGTGAGGQTFITSDGDQFRNAVTAYSASPYPLP